MANFFIEDKYYEAKLPDGSVVFTRTRYIVNALKYYRNECYNIIKNGERFLHETPRLVLVESYEEAMKTMDKISNTHKKVQKAYELIEKIDAIFKQLASGGSSSEPKGPTMS